MKNLWQYVKTLQLEELFIVKHDTVRRILEIRFPGSYGQLVTGEFDIDLLDKSTSVCLCINFQF